MNRAMFNGRKTKVAAVPYGRRWLSAWIISLMFCLCLFSSDAMAQPYSIFNSGVSDVYGIYDVDGLVLDGDEFGSVIVIASDANAYSIYSSGGNITIYNLFDSVGIITATAAGLDNAFGLFTPNGSIYTDGLDGTINSQAEDSWAVGLYSPSGDVNTADIGGTISSQVGNEWAVGLYGHSINTGDIDGVISAVASNSLAFGLYSNGATSIHTGDINGTIYAEATYGSDAYAMYSGSDITVGDIGSDANIVAVAETGDAYGLYSGGGVSSIHTGNINGKISADVNDGSGAYAMYSESDIIIDGNIGSTALIRATATGGVEESAYGMYSGGSINIGDVNGTISAEMTDGSDAYAIYAANDVTVGNIGNDANIWAAAEYGNAAGISSGGGAPSIHTGDIDGKISADVNDGSYASGIYSDSGITTGDIGSDALISATVSQEYAIAVGSFTGDVNTGDINGTVTAIAGSMYASGLSAGNGSVITGDINGTISAMAENGNAAGLFSGVLVGSIHTGDVNGVIIADVNNGSWASGMYSDSDITTGNITSNALISATAAEDQAAALYSDGGSIYTYDIDGVITADANNYAYGLYSASGATIYTDGINGTITADANDSYAYAMYSDGNIEIEGDIGSDAVITATAGDSDAYGLYSAIGDVNTGDIDGTVTAVAGSSYAAGLRANSGSVITGDIDGTISAAAETEYAYGLYSSSGTSIHVGDVNGVITADVNNGSFAYGMYSDSDITTGNIGSDANITANAGNNQAYGLYSVNDSITTGAIDGTITATAGNRRAYGLRSDGSLTTGVINGTINATAMDERAFGLCSDSNSVTTAAINGTISATAEHGYAYGLYSGGGASIHTGDVNGVITADVNDGSFAYGMYSDSDITTGNIGSDANITANAGNNQAYGLYSSGSDSITTGDIDGTITATAGNDRAYGLRSDGPLTTGAIDGTIVATVGNERASGLYSDSNSITTGPINGAISATAGADNAFGLRSQGSITTGAINGTIDVDAGGEHAVGLRSYDSITTGHIGGTIDVNASGDRAFALRSDDSLTTGAIDGTITVKAGNDRAVGLYSLGASSLTTGAISGTIDVNAAGDFAYGILSWGPMDVTIDGGTISAVAVAGPNVAAIQSGQMTGIPITLETQDANDTLGIVAGSTIIGDIDLARFGTDDDLLTLSGVDSNSTTFTDDINNVETINVTGGTFYVDANVLNSTNGVTMYGGILGGTGNLLCDLYVIDGIFAPGHSIDTINIGGDWTHDPNGVFEVEVNNAEEADKVIVGKTAYLDGTIRGKAIGERIDHSFTTPEPVIDANGLDGEFSTVTGTTLFPIYSAIYDTDNNDVFLGVEFDYAYYATTANQHALGNALNYIVSNGLDTGDMNDVLTAIEHLPNGAAANNAYDQMMPQDALGLPEVIRNAMNQYSEGLFGRMGDVRNAGLYAMSADSRYLLASADNSLALPRKTDEWMPFAKGFGVWADRDKDSGIAGYQYNVYGLAGGADKMVSDNTLIGISVGGSRAKVDYGQWGTSADIDSFFASLYGSYFVDDWHFGVTLGYGHSWYDSQRGIPAFGLRAESDHQGNSYSAAAELGKNLGDESTILEPVVGLGYTLVRERGYTEKGAGALNLKVDSETTDGIYSRLGIRAAKEFRSEKNPDRVLVPNVSAFWIHDFADRVELSSSFIGGGSFTTEGQDPIRDMFNLGAGVNVYSGENTRLFVDYTWQLSSDFQSSMVQARLQRRF